MIFQIAMGILVVLLLVADMVSRNQPPPEEPQEWGWMYPDDFDDDF